MSPRCAIWAMKRLPAYSTGPEIIWTTFTLEKPIPRLDFWGFLGLLPTGCGYWWNPQNAPPGGKSHPLVCLNNIHRSSAACELYASPRKKERKKNDGSCIFHPYGDDATTGPRVRTFAFLGDLVNVINRTNFGTDRFRGFVLWRNVKDLFLCISLFVNNTVLSATGQARDVFNSHYALWDLP